MYLTSRLVVAGALLAACALPARAQSLGDLAAKEAARRKATPAPAKTYTNDDLKKAQGLPDDQTAKSDTDKPADTKDTKDAKDAKDSKNPDVKPTDVPDSDKAAPADPSKDEKYWRARMTAVKEEIRRNQAFAEALQSRINALTADFAARDDPAQRAQVADDRQKALAELDRVHNEIEKGNKSVADIEEEARRAGVPPGWLR